MRSANDLDAAFDAAIRERADALLVFGNTFFQLNRTRIIGLAAQHHLPAIYGRREWADEGGLMAYAAAFTAGYLNAATFVGKILKGAKPADLPIEQPSTFDFVINLTTKLQRLAGAILARPRGGARWPRAWCETRSRSGWRPGRRSRSRWSRWPARPRPRSGRAAGSTA